MTSPERQLEDKLIEKLVGLKYEYRDDIRDRDALEKNFRKKFDALNHVRLTDGEFQRLLEEVITSDVYTATHTLRNRNSFVRDDGTPLNYKLVNINDWCKNTFEVIHQLRINTDNSHHRYDVILLINGVPAVQIELKTLSINPRRAIEQASFKTTHDLFQKSLHEYTITHAIEDRNVLRFHVDYFKPKGQEVKPDGTLTKKAVVDAILDKHDAATGGRRFNAILATASINEAIEYYALFDAIQNGRKIADPNFVPLNVAAVFSPPADVSADVRQLQEDLPQEQEDNKQDPEQKKKALKSIIDHYNERFGTNYSIDEFDQYYQDIQKRIKDQQFPNADLPKKGREKLDVTIVVDMLLTGFDSKYLNTLYVDKNLKHHGLIQAFSRTNRVLNDTKPYGNILDFRGQQDAVDAAIALFSGAKADKAREIWLVDKAPVVIDKLKAAKKGLDSFLKCQGLSGKPEEIVNLKGDDARAAFIKHFMEVQRLQTQLDQYTDMTPEQEQLIETILPKNELTAFRGEYLETAQRLREQREKPGEKVSPAVEQLDFEFVLFASAVIDYDYIMKLITDFQAMPAGKATMNREQLIGLIAADSKFIDERDAITEYVRSLKVGEGLDEAAIRAGYQQFKDEKHAAELAAAAEKHGLAPERLQTFVDTILNRMIFDGEQLTELLSPLDLGWRARTEKELAVMADLVPLLKKRADGREIAGLKAYEE